jgi:crotonobetainyl-CoA:carnitine CoA-transferase CaiB-like acyl-CoA transferase
VDVSLLHTGFHILGNDVANALVSREPLIRHDRKRPPNPLWNSYPTADGRWLLFVMIDPSNYWERFCRALGHPEWQTDARYAGDLDRAKHAAELAQEIEAELLRRPLADWGPVLDGAGLIWAPVRQLHEAIDDPQAAATGCFAEVAHPRAGSFQTVAPPFRIDGVDLAPKSAAPGLGADSESLLREVGASADEIAAITARRD